jgi:deoxyribonuclease-4
MYGSHLSIAGGMHNAVTAATALGMTTVQVFTKNQQQWLAKPIADEACSAWCSACAEAAFEVTVSHDSYLINLASADEALWRKSVDAFAEEVRRCEQLRIPLLVTHPGAHLGTGEEAGLRRVAAGLDEVFSRDRKSGTTVCLEITAGQGTSLGYRLEHLAEIISLSKHEKRLAVCLDTAHLLAAGIDFRGRKYATFKKRLGELDLLDRVRVWHLNDSKKDLGTRVDRHEHIGKGFVGLDGFRPIVRDKAWRETPKILETAKGKDEQGREWDEINLEALKSLE